MRDRGRLYGQCVEEAGQLLIRLNNEGVLTDQRLPVLVAALEGDVDPAVNNPSGVFALYVGGPRIELADGPDGWRAEYVAEGERFPPDLILVPSTTPLSDITRRRLGLGPGPAPVDQDRCRRYAEACRRLAESVPIAETPPAETPPAGDSPEPDNPLSPSRRKAYDAYTTAISQNPALAEATDDDVYAWIREHMDRDEYPSPPTCGSFKAYLRGARQHYKTQKNTPTGGRTGRSVRPKDGL